MTLHVSIDSVCMDNGLARFQPHILRMRTSSHNFEVEIMNYFFYDLDDDLFLCLRLSLLVFSCIVSKPCVPSIP